jgi:hypothetical protein
MRDTWQAIHRVEARAREPSVALGARACVSSRTRASQQGPADQEAGER